MPSDNSVIENYNFHFSTKTYVVGTQKNRLNETVLLSTQNTCFNWLVRKYLQFCARKVSLSETHGIDNQIEQVFQCIAR